MSKKNQRVNWCILRDNRRLMDSIRYWMKIHRLTIYQLAANIEIDKARISRYFNRKVGRVSCMELVKICDYLGLEVELDIRLKDE